MLQGAPEDCTGCNLCVEVCPVGARKFGNILERNNSFANTFGKHRPQQSCLATSGGARNQKVFTLQNDLPKQPKLQLIEHAKIVQLLQPKQPIQMHTNR